MSIISGIRGRFKGAESEASVFLKTVEADTKVAVAEARIKAVDFINKAKHEIAETLEKEASRVHAEADAVNERFESILSKL